MLYTFIFQQGNRVNVLPRQILIVCLMVVACGASLSRFAAAERPGAPKLLPESTLAYVRISDFQDLKTRFSLTQMGQMFQDPEMKPLVGQLYQEAVSAFEQVEREVGASLPELLAIPKREVCFAMVGRDQGEPAAMLLMDIGEDDEVPLRVLEKGKEQFQIRGGSAVLDKVGDVELVRVKGRGDFQGCYFVHEGTFVFTSVPDLAEEILKVWNGDMADVKTLADNPRFASIMRASAGTKNERPQLSWYVDPLGLVKQINRNNFGTQAVLALLPGLGLDSLKGVGGSMIFSAEEFDSIMHFHVMIDSPRKGVMEVLALGNGGTEPEDWIPTDVATYTTLHWNIPKTYEVVQELFNIFRGSGAFEGEVNERIGARLGVNVQEDLINQLAGRVTLATWMEKPVRINSQVNLIGIKLKDAGAFQPVLEKMIYKIPRGLERKKFMGVEYYQVQVSENPRTPPNLTPEMVRQPQPCIGIIGDYLVASDSLECFKTAVRTKLDPEKSLAAELDYKLVASNIQRHMGRQKPCMIAFQRPEVSMRMMYDLAVADTTKQFLDRQAGENQVLGVVNRTLKDNPLPPFEVISKYLSPGGAMMVDDETGIHYTAFSLKREVVSEQEQSQEGSATDK